MLLGTCIDLLNLTYQALVGFLSNHGGLTDEAREVVFSLRLMTGKILSSIYNLYGDDGDEVLLVARNSLCRKIRALVRFQEVLRQQSTFAPAA